MHSVLRFVCAVLSLLVFCVSSMAEKLDLLSNPSRVTIFSASSTVPYVNSEDKSEEKNVHSFRIPSLVNVDGVLVAIAEAHYDTSGDVSSIDIVATYSVDNGETWKTEVIIKNSGVSSVSRVVEPTVVVKDTKIFVLVGSFNNSNNFWADHYNDKDWDPLLVVGEVTISTSKEGAKTASITWAKPVSLKDQFIKQKQRLWTLFVGGTRTALLMSNGTIVFPLQIVSSRYYLPTIMYSNDNGSTWTYAKDSSFYYGSSEPSLIEWEGKLIMSCRRENEMRRFYESSDMGNTWVESEYKLSRVWGNAPDRQGPGTPGSLIAVNIDGVRVMLFILPLNTKKDRARDRLNLWMTDNNRIFDVGQVSVDDENTGYSSLLYHEDKLYCAHEVNNRDAFSIVLTTLDEHLERIKSTVKSWKENDKKLSDLCIPVGPAATDKGGKACGDNITTSGLVGWLSGDLKDNIWKDKYSCVDAKVTNAIATPYGAKFYGSGSGALWPVSAQGQNRRYLFAKNAFTLTAIVSIHKVPEPGKLYPVMGGSWVGSHGRDYTALSYNSNRKWVPEYGEDKFHPTKSWKLNRKYHVAISLGHLGEEERKKFSVYVDGELLQCKEGDFNFYDYTDGIENFYIGSPQNYHKDAKGYITVSNVMLYNRKLSDEEIMTLSRGKYMIDEHTMTISQSTTLSITPSLSLVPSAKVPKDKAPAASPVSEEQTARAPKTETDSGSASTQSKPGNEQKGSDNSANDNTHDAPPQPQIPTVPLTKDNTVRAPSLHKKTTSDDSAGVEKPKDGSADTTTTNNSSGNAAKEPKDIGSAAPPTEQRTDSNTDTSSSTSTSTSLPVKVRPNSGSGDTSVSGFNPSHGAERRSDSTEEKSDEDKKRSNRSANENTNAASPQPKNLAVPSKNNNTVSASSLPENPTSDGGAAKAELKDSGADTTTTNNSGGNASKESKDSGSAVTPTEQRTDSNTDTSSSTSTSTSVPVEVPSNSNSGDTSVTGLNMSNGEESKSDPPQVESDKDNKKSSDSPYDDSDRAYVPLTSLLLSALLGFATFC